MKEKYMKEAINQAKKAYKKNEVPVGAVIVCDNKIIAKSYNMREKKKNAIKHAEIIAIAKACKKKKTWKLDDCEIYVTMEPCLMCFGAIMQARIKKIYYGIENEKYGYHKFVNKKTIENLKIENEIMKKESLDLVKVFFKNMR